MHTAFGSVEVNSVTELASTATIQHQHSSRDLRVRPETTGVT